MTTCAEGRCAANVVRGVDACKLFANVEADTAC
jgi:hypothetical protein